MKRCLPSALFGALLVCMALFPAARAASPVTGFSVEWTGEAPALTAVATWEYEGERYEMAVTGIGSRLVDEKLKAVAEACHAGEKTMLTDPALRDAEKFSHLIPHNAGAEDAWLVMDDVRLQEAWGDSLLCWAASTANMLASTGWAQLAKDPVTGESYPDEDAVLSYLTQSFLNDGNFQDEGIRWFFSGRVKDVSALRDGSEPKKQIAEKPEAYMTSMLAEERGRLACRSIADMTQAIKKGAAMGISVTVSSTAYGLLADPAREVSLENGRYVEYDFLSLDEEEYYELPEHFWTFDSAGGVVILHQDGDTYRDDSGKAYPEMSVKYEHLWYDEKLGVYAVPQPEKSGFSYSVTRRIPHEKDEVDLAHPHISGSEGLGNGGHALTVGGYIRNVSKGNDETGGLVALLIADSDNDANIWEINADTPKKEARPNTYTLCTVERKVVGDTPTLNIRNYLEDGTAYIAYACLLYPKSAKPGPVPVPKTGDATPFGPYVALMLFAGAGFALTLKKRVPSKTRD